MIARISRRMKILIGVAVALVIVVVVAVSVTVGGVGGSGAPPTPTLSYTAQALRPGEDTILNSYGWVDEKNGIARIPIDRAIDLTAQRGLPARPTSTAHSDDENQTIPSYSSSGTQPMEWLH